MHEFNCLSKKLFIVSINDIRHHGHLNYQQVQDMIALGDRLIVRNKKILMPDGTKQLMTITKFQ